MSVTVVVDCDGSMDHKDAGWLSPSNAADNGEFSLESSSVTCRAVRAAAAVGPSILARFSLASIRPELTLTPGSRTFSPCGSPSERPRNWYSIAHPAVRWCRRKPSGAGVGIAFDMERTLGFAHVSATLSSSSQSGRCRGERARFRMGTAICRGHAPLAVGRRCQPTAYERNPPVSQITEAHCAELRMS